MNEKMKKWTGTGRYYDNWVYGTPRTPKGLVYINDWGSLRHAANAAYGCLLAADLGLPNTYNYRAFAKQQINYALGDSGRSNVLGFGNNPPQKSHHRAAWVGINSNKSFKFNWTEIWKFYCQVVPGSSGTLRLRPGQFTEPQSADPLRRVEFLKLTTSLNTASAMFGEILRWLNLETNSLSAINFKRSLRANNRFKLALDRCRHKSVPTADNKRIKFITHFHLIS
jgi:hypothetical protein